MNLIRDLNFIFSRRRRDAISLLYALWYKEECEASGFRAFVGRGMFPGDRPWEVYVHPVR